MELFICPQGSVLHFSSSLLLSFIGGRLEKNWLFVWGVGHTVEQLLPRHQKAGCVSEALSPQCFLSSCFLPQNGMWESKGMVIAVHVLPLSGEERDRDFKYMRALLNTGLASRGRGHSKAWNLGWRTEEKLDREVQQNHKGYVKENVEHCLW